MRRKNRSHGKMDRLPNTLKEAVNDQLVKGYTYQQISDYLTRMGQEITPKVVAKYGRQYLAAFEQVRMAREAARILAEDNADRPPTELNEANNALINQLVMELLINSDASPEEKLKTARAVAELQKAQVQNERLKMDARKAGDPARAALSELKRKVFERLVEYPELAEEIARVADEVEAETRIAPPCP